jgi:hypothetical protein
MTKPTLTDWRALCAELLGALENEGHAHWPGGPDGDLLIEQARAALAEPEPAGEVSDEDAEVDFDKIFYQHAQRQDENFQPLMDVQSFSEACSAIALDRSHPAPVPVSERPILKSSPFNDSQGRCWCGTGELIDRTGDMPIEYPASWELREPSHGDDCLLPAHALPLPDREVG